MKITRFFNEPAESATHPRILTSDHCVEVKKNCRYQIPNCWSTGQDPREVHFEFHSSPKIDARGKSNENTSSEHHKLS